MSFHFEQIQALSLTLSSTLVDWKLKKWLMDGPEKIFFIFEKNTITKILFLNFVKPWIRFHFIHRLPHSYLAHFPDADHLEGSTLTHVEVVPQERIVLFTFVNHATYTFVAEFFSKHPNYYLLGKNRSIIRALHPSSHTTYELPAPKNRSFTSVDPLLSHEEMEVHYQHLELDQAKKQALLTVEKQLKKLFRRQLQLQEDLKKSEKWLDVQQEGELLKAHFHLLKRGLHSIKVWNWYKEEETTISLNSLLTPPEEIAQRFKQSRKKQAAIPHLQRQLLDIQTSIKELQKMLEQLEKVMDQQAIIDIQKTHPSLFQLTTPTKKNKIQLALPYKQYISASGLKILVGKNARANDMITFQIAHGSDWWLHAHHLAGSHVIIRMSKGQEPDPETLQDAVQLALYHSKAKQQGKGEVCVTQRKYISRLGKKQLGKVQVSKHKTVYAHLDMQRYQNLKNRMINPHL